jgi:hypothetical protein
VVGLWSATIMVPMFVQMQYYLISCPVTRASPHTATLADEYLFRQLRVSVSTERAEPYL